MSYQRNGLTIEEYFRHNNTLPSEDIETLLVMVDTLKPLLDVDVRGEIQDARSCLPCEDVLQDTIDDLRNVAQRVRGINHQHLMDIIGELEQKKSDLCQELRWLAGKLDTADARIQEAFDNVMFDMFY